MDRVPTIWVLDRHPRLWPTTPALLGLLSYVVLRVGCRSSTAGPISITCAGSRVTPLWSRWSVPSLLVSSRYDSFLQVIFTYILWLTNYIPELANDSR